MIGTSDGEQYTSSFEHTVASTIPPGASTEPADALIQSARYPGSPQPLGRSQDPSVGMRLEGAHKDLMDSLDWVNPHGSFKDEPTMEQGFRKAQKQVDEHAGELNSKGAIDPERIMEDKGITGDDLGMVIDPGMPKDLRRQFNPEGIKQNIVFTGTPANDNKNLQIPTPNLDDIFGKQWNDMVKKGNQPDLKIVPKPGSSLPQPLISVLSHPDIANAIANPKIDRDHEVPYVAGASSKPNDFTTHVDKSVPSSVTISGKTFDPAIPLNIHEQVEKHVMEQLKSKGMTDEKAYEIAHHEFAEVAEDAWYKSQGIDVKDVNKWWSKIDQKTEKDTGDFPKNLYKAPYPHDKVEGVKHEPSGVSAEWAMGKLAGDFKPLNPMQPAYSNPGGHSKTDATTPGRATVESIYTPAIKHQDGSIHMGDNHGEAYRNSFKETGVRPLYTEDGQGFITSSGRYVDRKEAATIAEKAGQIAPTDKLDRLAKKSRETFGLSSEDLEMGPLPTHDSRGWVTSHGRKYYDENTGVPDDPINR